MNTKEREKIGEVRLFYETLICKLCNYFDCKTVVNKFERLSHNLMENKKDTGMSNT